MATHVVRAAAVNVTDENGKITSYYQGAFLPDGTPKSEIARLEADGMVGKLPELVSTVEEPYSAGGPLPAVTAEEPLVPTYEVLPPGAIDRPAQVANKAKWVDFAVGQGLTPDEAESLTKAELVEMYGGSDA